VELPSPPPPPLPFLSIGLFKSHAYGRGVGALT